MTEITPFWGNEDSSITFCETNYNTSPYIAEYYNTLSGLIYSFVGLYFLNTNIKSSAYAMIVLGLSTSFFHGTMRYYGQWCDEMSMLYLSFMLIKEIHPNIPYIYLFGMFGLYGMYWQEFAMFFYMFMLMQTYVYLLSMEFRKIKENNYYFVIKEISIYFAMGFWLLDMFLCNYGREYFHAGWHIFTGISLWSGGKLISNYKKHELMEIKLLKSE